MSARLPTRRLLFISSEFPPGPGGIGTHAYQICRRLAAAGWDVLALTPMNYATDSEISAFLGAQSFRVVRLLSGAGAVRLAFGRLGALLRLRRVFRPDVIVGSGERAVWLAWIASRLFGVPWLAVGHATEFGVRRWSQIAANRRAFSAASAVVCVSEYTWERMGRLGVRPRRGGVILNGADEGVFRTLDATEVAAFRRGRGWEKKRLLVTVGSVTPRKGQDIVVRALPRIVESVPNAHYVAVGIPEVAEECFRLASEMGVRDHVEFPGRMHAADLVGTLNCAEVFLMTSRHTAGGDFEGYGIAVTEAALCGLPAVVSGDSGVVEAIIPGSTGLVVPQEDPAATAGAAVLLLTDPQLRACMAGRALEDARKNRTWTHRVEQYTAVLDGLLARQRGAFEAS